jgi:hypothetical protein
MLRRPEGERPTGYSTDDMRKAARETLYRDCKETAVRMGNTHVTEREIRQQVDRIADRADKDLDSRRG